MLHQPVALGIWLANATILFRSVYKCGRDSLACLVAASCCSNADDAILIGHNSCNTSKWHNMNCGVWQFTLDSIMSSHGQCAMSRRNAGVSLCAELLSIDPCSFELTIAICIPCAYHMHDSQRMTVCGPPYRPFKVRTSIIQQYGVRSMWRYVSELWLYVHGFGGPYSKV